MNKLVNFVVILSFLLILFLNPIFSQDKNVPGIKKAQNKSGFEVTYVFNEGFILYMRDKKILIDALLKLHEKAAPQHQVSMEKAQPPFDDADLVLITHFHWDHFDADVVRKYMLHNKKAILVTSMQVINKLREGFQQYDDMKSRIKSINPVEGQKEKLNVQGIDLEIVNLYHSLKGRNKSVMNLGFLISYSGKKILHIGDSAAKLADIKPLEFTKDHIDIAFLPFWYYTGGKYRDALIHGFNAQKYVVMHLPETGNKINEYISEIKSTYPQAMIPIKVMEKFSIILER